MKTKFVGTVTDKSFFQAVWNLQLPQWEEKVYINDIREGVIEYYDVIFAVELYQSIRFYWDEV